MGTRGLSVTSRCPSRAASSEGCCRAPLVQDDGRANGGAAAASAAVGPARRRRDCAKAAAVSPCSPGRRGRGPLRLALRGGALPPFCGARLFLRQRFRLCVLNRHKIMVKVLRAACCDVLCLRIGGGVGWWQGRALRRGSRCGTTEEEEGRPGRPRRRAGPCCARTVRRRPCRGRGAREEVKHSSNTTAVVHIDRFLPRRPAHVLSCLASQTLERCRRKQAAALHWGERGRRHGPPAVVRTNDGAFVTVACPAVACSLRPLTSSSRLRGRVCAAALEEESTAAASASLARVCRSCERILVLVKASGCARPPPPRPASSPSPPPFPPPASLPLGRGAAWWRSTRTLLPARALPRRNEGSDEAGAAPCCSSVKGGASVVSETSSSCCLSGRCGRGAGPLGLPSMPSGGARRPGERRREPGGGDARQGRPKGVSVLARAR